MPTTSSSLLPPTSSRREFIRSAGTLTAATALGGLALPHVHAAGSDIIQVAIVGCGGRRTGAVANALATRIGRLKLVAMADVFQERLQRSDETLKNTSKPRTEGTADSWVTGFEAAQVEVPPDRRFLGFDAYRKAMDCLKPGDVVILTTPVAFRWVHFAYAIEKGLHVFMEKPITVDGPTTRRMIALAGEAAKKNLKVGVGLMCRHCAARLELFSGYMPGCHEEFASYALGTKGSAVISTFVHTPAKCRLFKGYNLTRADMAWAFPQPEPNPYQLEWDHLVEAIQANLPYNEVERGPRRTNRRVRGHAEWRRGVCARRGQADHGLGGAARRGCGRPLSPAAAGD